MKNLKIAFAKISIFVLVCSVFVACKKDIALLFWPEGTGDYASYTIGSKFTYQISYGNPAVIDTFFYTVVKDTTINGAKFMKMATSNPNLVTDFFCNYNPITGVRTDINFNTNFGGIPIPELKETTLRAKQPLNAVWNEKLNVSASGASFTLNFDYKISQKNFTKKVFSTNYKDVIQVDQTITLPQSLVAALEFPTDKIGIINFYSKEVGILQRDFPDGLIGINFYKLIKADIKR
jgi:hypothetical protein